MENLRRQEDFVSQSLQGVITISEKSSGQKGPIIVDSQEQFKKLTADMVKKLGAATLFNVVSGVMTYPHGYDPTLDVDNQLLSTKFFLLSGQESTTFTFTLSMLEGLTEQLRAKFDWMRKNAEKLKEVLKRQERDKSETYIR